MRVLPCGDAGLLVEVASLEEVLAAYAAFVERPPAGVTEIVPAARTVLLRVDPGTDLAPVAAAVRATTPRPGARPDAGHVEVAVRYDGADLAEVGELTGLGERGVVEAHTSQEWTVAFCGFAPGFGYLVGEDDRLHVPRREDPRTRVPAGALGLAGEFTGVYPRESPGGWQLIGHALDPVWDLRRTPPAVLTAGVRVRFREAR
ncbi:5-oxoprolinase subunit B family protein [Nocardioides panaciterrulae]|uniref:KipI family sensor histidine kinase inhibitor n=1 Tax=Nocardioides panaciterrulae TaxID=661492 RepID=A0A7Y9E4S5_9ACTN|nr:allophanate hydrolase subunit 1 [Nocardioides panaciterrulae]NYD41115.1 KipI family sensor histidine kinase inhibitor [Nocardioides panaciterrulae]